MVLEQGQGAPLPSEGELLRRLPKLVKRMRKVCLELMEGSRLPHLVEGLDQFTGGCRTRGGQGGWVGDTWVLLDISSSVKWVKNQPETPQSLWFSSCPRPLLQTSAVLSYFLR